MLTVVEISVGAHENPRRNLPETIDDTVDTEVGRARGPDRAEAGCAEHRDDRFGAVRQEGSDTISFLHPGRAEAGCRFGDSRAQVIETQLAAVAIFALPWGTR